MVFFAVPIVQPVIHDGRNTDADRRIPVIDNIQYIIIPRQQGRFVHLHNLFIEMMDPIAMIIDIAVDRPVKLLDIVEITLPVKDFLQCTDFLKVFVDLKACTKSKADLFDTSDHLPI